MSVAINKVEAGAPVSWLKGGWDLFTKAWLKLIIGLVVFYIGVFIVGFIPIIGQIALVVAGPLMMIAAILAMRDIEKTGDFDWQRLFDTVKTKITPTLIICAVNIGLVILMVIANLIIFSGGAMIGGMTSSLEGSMFMSAVLSGLIVIVFGILFGLANMFSLPLIALTDTPAIEALKASVKASFQNILAMILFGLIMFGLFFLSMLTLGLGFLVVAPVSIGATYFATKSLFPVAAQ